MDFDTDVQASIADAALAASASAEMQAPRLPDVLRDGLDVVFVGMAAGAESTARGIYYAKNGNSFWDALRQAELTPARFAKEQFLRLPEVNIGLTDLSKTAYGMDRDVVVTQEDLDEFDAKIRASAPRAIAFTGKAPAARWLHRRTSTLRYGRQPRRDVDLCEVFVLTSPSAAARRYWSLTPWYELADWLRTTAPWRF